MVVGVPTFRPDLEYPLPPPCYIPLEISTLLTATTSEVQGDVSIGSGRGRATMNSKSVIATSSHHRIGSSKIQVARQNKSVGSHIMHKDQEISETSTLLLCYFVVILWYHVVELYSSMDHALYLFFYYGDHDWDGMDV